DDRAAATAKRRAAVHAARGLHLGLGVVDADDEFLVVLDAFGRGRVALFNAAEFHETGDLSHVLFLLSGVGPTWRQQRRAQRQAQRRAPERRPAASPGLPAPGVRTSPTARACIRSGRP